MPDDLELAARFVAALFKVTQGRPPFPARRGRRRLGRYRGGGRNARSTSVVTHAHKPMAMLIEERLDAARSGGSRSSSGWIRLLFRKRSGAANKEGEPHKLVSLLESSTEVMRKAKRASWRNRGADRPKLLALAKHGNVVVEISAAGTLGKDASLYKDIWDPQRRIFDASGLTARRGVS